MFQLQARANEAWRKNVRGAAEAKSSEGAS
jgi:hypothetical protein